MWMSWHCLISSSLCGTLLVLLLMHLNGCVQSSFHWLIAQIDGYSSVMKGCSTLPLGLQHWAESSLISHATAGTGKSQDPGRWDSSAITQVAWSVQGRGTRMEHNENEAQSGGWTFLHVFS
jgi:hypothetical protein